MATLQSRLTALAQAAGANDKAIKTLVNGNAADLAALTTTDKTNLVAALNEIKGAVDVLQSNGGAIINDSATNSTNAWSSTKITSEISSAVNGLIDSAPGTLDTLNELAQALGDDPNFATTITTALSSRVRTDTAAQGLDSTEQANARTNIDAYGSVELGDPDTDLAAAFTNSLA